MKTKESASSFASGMIQHCDKEAEEICESLIKELDASKVKGKERIKFAAFMLSDELVHFFYGTVKMYLNDPEGIKRMRSWTGARAGKASGLKRWNESRKYKFLVWALAENKRNPSLSKNLIAQKYAKDNPGESVATLRRYLSMIPKASDGVD